MQKIFERFPEGSSAYIPIMIGYHTGLRLGEIYGLVWEDIDFENKTLSVNRQVQWEAGEARSEEEKNKNTNDQKTSYKKPVIFSEPPTHLPRFLPDNKSHDTLLILP